MERVVAVIRSGAVKIMWDIDTMSEFMNYHVRYAAMVSQCDMLCRDLGGVCCFVRNVCVHRRRQSAQPLHAVFGRFLVAVWWFSGDLKNHFKVFFWFQHQLRFLDGFFATIFVV